MGMGECSRKMALITSESLIRGKLMGMDSLSRNLALIMRVSLSEISPMIRMANTPAKEEYIRVNSKIANLMVRVLRKVQTTSSKGSMKMGVAKEES